MESVSIFSGSSSKKLASDLAKYMDGRLGDVELSTFTNQEIRVFVKEKTVRNQAVVIQSLSSPTERNLIEFCLLCDALSRMGVSDITAIIPWLGYSKQDKVFQTGEPLSIKIIAKIVQTVPIKRLITFDLHNPAILGFFDIPVVNLTAGSLFIDYFKKKVTKNTVVVAPDAGAVKSSSLFADALGVPVVYLDKHRDLTTGTVTMRGMSRDVKGARSIILDDMIVTGSTLVETAHMLQKAGATHISVAATHHLYVPGAQEAIEKSGINEVVVTDTIERSQKYDTLRVASIVPILGTFLQDR